MDDLDPDSWRAAARRYRDRRDQFTGIHCRPATEQDYDAWLSGYRARGGTATIARFRSSWFVLSRDPAFLPELYGNTSIDLIVPAGMRVDGPRTFHGRSGHNGIYYMDEFRIEAAGASTSDAPCPPRARCGIDCPYRPAAAPEQEAAARADAETLRLAAEVLEQDSTVLDHEHHAAPLAAVLRRAAVDADEGPGADFRTVELARAILGGSALPAVSGAARSVQERPSAAGLDS